MILSNESYSIFAAHPWLRNEKNAIPLDILIYKLVKSYVRASPLKRTALKVKPAMLPLKPMNLMPLLSPWWGLGRKKE